MTAIIDAKTHPKSLVNFPGSRNTQKEANFCRAEFQRLLVTKKMASSFHFLTRCYFKVPPWGWP